MAERKAGDSSGIAAIVNVALVVVTIVGFLTLSRQELTSDRPAPPPKSEDGGIGSQTVDVRLWEDPLRPSKAIAGSLKSLADEIARRRDKTHRNVWLLSVMVSGGPYSEDQEGRIRSRFAVVSALGRNGYAPRDAEHVGSIVTPWPTTDQLDAWADGVAMSEPLSPTAAARCRDGATDCPRQMWVRYEWYRPRNFYPQAPDDRPEILVLWLDDRAFDDRPLLRLPILFAPLIEAARGAQRDPHEPVVRLIGPENSDTLRYMLPDEFGQRPSLDEPDVRTMTKPVLGEIELYSPMASAMDEVLVENVDPRDARREPVREKLRKSGFKDAHFFNVDDAEMADEIVDELELRGVRLTGGPGQSRTDAMEQNHIVLLSEWDTFYGRILSLTYGGALAVHSHTAPSRLQFVHDYMHGGALPENLHTFVYLRGLDGRTFCETGSGDCAKMHSADHDRGRPDSLEEVVRWRPEANKAEGPGQFDYLSRTGDRIAALQANLRLRDKGEIKAIGIVGSDVYDVLAILQALRARFPEVLFFTTGLDARLWNPKERDWSRNLLVGASYGLTLNPTLQGDVPPFRDSTQTAVFAATFAALDPRQLATLSHPSPRRFEIGNTMAVDLSTRSAAGIHPLTTSEAYADHAASGWQHRRVLMVFLLALLLLLAVYYAWNPFRRRTQRDCGFLAQDLLFAEPDVGDGAGAKLLVEAMARERDDSACNWMSKLLAERFRAVKACADLPPPTGDTSAGGMLSVAGAFRHEVDEKKLWKARSHVLVALLNDILHHATLVTRDVSAKSTLVDNGSLNGAEPWTGLAPRWQPVARLRAQMRTRALLDDFLGHLGATIDPPGQLPIVVAADARRAARQSSVVRLQLYAIAGGIALIGLAVLGSLARTIWEQTFAHPAGESFSLGSGTSAWPNIVLRVVSTFLGLVLVVVLVQQLPILFLRLSRRYRLPWTADPTQALPLRVQATELWREYYESGHATLRLVRAAIPTLLYFGVGRVILLLSGLPGHPGRGDAVAWWMDAVRYPFVLIFLLLSFLTIDAALRCRRFINALAALPTHYPSTTLVYFQSQRGNVGEEYLEEWIDIQLIADLTEQVGRLLWFPAIVFCVMMASLNSFTDQWPLSMGLMLILTMNLGLSIASVIILQRAAQKARCEAEDSLAAKLKRAQAVVAKDPEVNDATQAEKLLDEIRTLRRGAFVGFWENPALGAVLVPSSGTAMIQVLLWLWR